MKKSINDYKVGQELSLIMLKPNKGKLPISRTDEGVICLLDNKSKKYCEYGSKWKCKITQVKEKVLIIEPFEIINTAKEETFQAMEKAREVFRSR